MRGNSCRCYLDGKCAKTRGRISYVDNAGFRNPTAAYSLPLAAPIRTPFGHSPVEKFFPPNEKRSAHIEDAERTVRPDRKKQRP